jgi:nitroreductase
LIQRNKIKVYDSYVKNHPITGKTKELIYMENFESLLINRRSTRQFTSEPISPDDVHKLLQSALLAPTSKNLRSWEFIAIEEKNMLRLLSECKNHGCSYLENSSLAIVVLGDRTKTDVWIEDGSIAAIYMQLQAEELGIGSCWCQVRNRFKETEDSEQYVRDLLDIPHEYGVLCIIGFGHKEKVRNPNDIESLKWEKIHIGKFKSSDNNLIT